ncbi:GIY-YIG nuclease family protein [Liquorilactobacillus hordei]|uniref:GIY-YIG nuclease family protein n=1 Tax=Liquorilactobacillus hordei TaxID=468911 RepID=UPI000ACCC994|nr:GIY-YIG nuclease family protein [Liquorilactobacillus hordei]QYH51067.1 GIY-YIG nuclease family protein [Liquorilactobacillus hordei DSM 19519]
MTQGIYAIVNLLNNKYYIGQSKDIKSRWSEHIRTLNKPSDPRHHLNLYQDMINVGVSNFDFIILEECDTNKLNERENYYMLKYNSFIPNGYNKFVSHKDKYSNVQSRIRIENKYKLDKHKLLLLLENYNFEELGRKYNVTGNTVKQWCRTLGISSFAQDYQTELKKDKFKNKMRLIGGKYSRKRKVYMLDKKNEDVLMEFESIAEAARYMNVDPSNIERAFPDSNNKNRRKTSFGYKWRGESRKTS